MTINAYFEDVQVGDEIAPWTRTTDLMIWNRYASVNDEFSDLHMDDASSRARGLPGAIGQGNLLIGYIANAVRDWAGDEVEIREVGCEFRRMNRRGDELTVCGSIVEKHGGADGNQIRLTIEIRNNRGERPCPGHAVILLPSRTA